MLVIDFHLDLSMNALEWNRDLNLTVAETRATESSMTEKGRGTGTVSFPEMRRGRVALSSATVISRTHFPGSLSSGLRAQELSYGVAQGQLSYYRILERQGIVRIITDLPSLREHMAAWQAWESNPAQRQPPLGFVISMEGADPITGPDEVAGWWDQGLRIVSLCHYGLSAYGTGQPGPLTPRGKGLLRAMEDHGYILDVTHLADEAMDQALDAFGGPVLASHSNCRALVPGDRQMTDEVIQRLAERGAVIGAALDAWMLYPNWIKGGVTKPEVVSLNDYADHIDRVCQLTGCAKHAAIGTDLDGGYGTEQTPRDLDTIADLQSVPNLLRARGYSQSDVEAIMFRNWISLLERAWG